MALLGSLLKRGIKLTRVTEQAKLSPFEMQKRELKKLVNSAKNTKFGGDHSFQAVSGTFSQGATAFFDAFKENVPVYDYNSIYEKYWRHWRNGEKDVCWPGHVKYFALSSGTSEAASKYIPLTDEMINSIKKTGIRQIKSLRNFDLPDKVFTKGILMLGGSTDLNKNGNYYTGDLSGIQASKIPFWFQRFYKPGKEIARQRDWATKLDEITRKADKWDIGFVVGVPAWIQLMIEKILDYYKVDDIHQIWPNLEVFVHGGVAFEPYRKSFEKLLGKPVTYIETYLASEGFIAHQLRPGEKGMSLVLNNGLFYEFVPFNEKNFGADGEIVSNPESYMVHEVEEGVDYALLISTCAGSWRYMIGDTVRFISKDRCEIVITGRTKHFLSLCGEHLSVENMNQGVQVTAEKLNIESKEFTVAGVPYENFFAHKWYIGTDREVDNKKVKEVLDQALKELNDDYTTERSSALKEVFVKTIPNELFYKWLKLKGKEGGQNKFPRVLKKNTFSEWEDFLKKEGVL